MSTKKLLVVFGATGNQGNSVANTVLSDPQLCTKYSIRAITRKATHPTAQALAAAGAEVVEADMDDISTLPAALTGAHTVFIVTTTDFTGQTRAIETRQAKSVCSVALTAGASYLIWSSLDNISKLSGGKLTNAAQFDAKEEIEQYIRRLPVESSFFVPGSFMQNVSSILKPTPSPANDGTYILSTIMNPDTELPLIDITETGKWVAAILAEPEFYAGKRLCAATRMYTLKEIAEIMSKVTGKTVVYEKFPDEVFRGALPEPVRDMMMDMYVNHREYGYFGKEQGESVKWAANQARGELTEFEAFLRRNPLRL